jgi:hypothetical protein
MALSRDEKILVAEYVGAGILVREIADRLLSGRVTKVEMGLFRSLVKSVGRTAGRAAVRGVGTAGLLTRTASIAARRHPAGVALLAAYIAHREGVSMDTAMEFAEAELEEIQYQQRFVSPLLAPVQIASGVERLVRTERAPAPPRELFIGKKRKVSRANMAVKQGMKLLKAGGKAATGAKAGALAAGSFKRAVKAAGMANPKTKSKPGKGKSIMNKLARKLKKWW